jgi:F0F1-type ATP synthase membrane subunit b/b'
MVVGFLLVYLFVSRVFTPKIERIFSDRSFHIENVLKSAQRLKSEADRIEKDAAAALENAQIDIAEIESKIVSDLREQSLREKNKLYDLFSKKSKEESDSLIKSSDEVFASVAGEMGEIIDTAMQCISCSVRKKL